MTKKTRAAKIDGDVFYRAAQRNNLKTDNRTLNKIVRLVNSGMTVAQAAKIIAQEKK